MFKSLFTPAIWRLGVLLGCLKIVLLGWGVRLSVEGLVVGSLTCSWLWGSPVEPLHGLGPRLRGRQLLWVGLPGCRGQAASWGRAGHTSLDLLSHFPTGPRDVLFTSCPSGWCLYTAWHEMYLLREQVGGRTVSRSRPSLDWSGRSGLCPASAIYVLAELG